MSPGVAGIGGASFLADVGHEIPTALLPSLLTSTLGAPAAVTARHLAAELASVTAVHLEWAGHLPSMERLEEITALLVDHLS